MNVIGKLIMVATLFSGLLNSLLFLGAVVALLKQHVGVLAYMLGVPVAILLSPGVLILPWFAAWVDGSSVKVLDFWIWASFFICLVLRAVFWKWAPDK